MSSRRVADDGQFGNATVQLDGDLPHGRVAINLLLVAGEAAMYGTQTLHACLVETLQRTNPQLDVGVHGVLHEHGNVHALQRVGQCLHGKGVGRGTGSHPEDVNAVLQRQLHVLGRGHLGRNQHARLFLHLLHPGQRLLAVALEAAWLGARLPHTGAEVVTAFHSQLSGGCQHLLLGLSRTWACNHEGAFVVTR